MFNRNAEQKSQKFLEAMSEQASKPDPKFRESLYRKMLGVRDRAVQEQRPGLFKSLLVMKKASIKWVAISGLVVIGFAAVSGGGYYLIKRLNPNGSTVNDDSPVFMSRSQALAKANEMDAKASAVNSSPEDTVAGEYLDFDAIQDFSDYGYHYWKNETTYGPKADGCYAYIPEYVVGLDSYVSEGYSYYSEDGTFADKYIEHLGDVETVSIFTDDYQINYFGGEYAVQENFPSDTDGVPTMEEAVIVEEEAAGEELEEAELPIGEEVAVEDGDDSDDSVSSWDEYAYTEPDISEEPIERNGRYVYVVDYTREVSTCDGSGKKVKLIEKQYLDAVTGDWAETDMYIGDETPESLVYTNVTESEYKDVAFEEVADVFVLDADVETVEIDSIDEGAIETSIKNSEAPVLLLDDKELKEMSLTYIEVMSSPFYGSYNDRSFFAEGEMGEKLYEYYNGGWRNEMYIDEGIPMFSPLTLVGYSTGDLYMDIQAGEDEVTQANVENIFGPDISDVELVANVQVTVAGVDGDQTIVGKLYEITVKELIIDDGEEIANYGDETTLECVMTFEYKGYGYLVAGNGLSDGMSNFSAIELDLSDDKAVEKAVKEINKDSESSSDSGE